jgi:8-oxo-dGTP diphosphatase
MLKDWLTDLNEMEKDVPHRPGKLYRFKKGSKLCNTPGKSSSRKALV